MALRRACWRILEHSAASAQLISVRVPQAAAPSRELHTLQASVLQRCRQADCTAAPAADSPACGPSRVQAAVDLGLERAVEYVRGVGMWLAVPKKKVSRHRRGQRLQHQKIKPTAVVAQCGVCERIIPARSIVSNCRIPECPCGPPKPPKAVPALEKEPSAE